MSNSSAHPSYTLVNFQDTEGAFSNVTTSTIMDAFCEARVETLNRYGQKNYCFDWGTTSMSKCEYKRITETTLIPANGRHKKWPYSKSTENRISTFD